MKIMLWIWRIVAFFLLLFIGIETGWSEENSDFKYLITEAEIEENMSKSYRKGCAIGGGCLLSFPYIGKHFDRRRAIRRIAQQKGWPEKNPVLDDNGYWIPNSMIEANMGKGYRTGCCIGGCLFAAPAFLLGIAFLAPPAPGAVPDETAGLAVIVSSITFEVASYYIGRHLDRRRAINRIKEKRRQQKKIEINEQEINDIKEGGGKSPKTALGLSLCGGVLLPIHGIGQFYNGDIRKGFLFSGWSIGSWLLILAGIEDNDTTYEEDPDNDDSLMFLGLLSFLGSYITSSVDAYNSAKHKNEESRYTKLPNRIPQNPFKITLRKDKAILLSFQHIF